MKTPIQLDPIGPQTFRVYHTNRPKLTLGHIYMETDGSHVFETADNLTGAFSAYVLRGIADEIDKLDIGWLAMLKTTLPPTSSMTASAA